MLFPAFVTLQMELAAVATLTFYLPTVSTLVPTIRDSPLSLAIR